MDTLVNRGTGAGGAVTNTNGLAFEKKTDNTERLKANKFLLIRKNSNKYGWYLQKKIDDSTMIYFMQKSALDMFCKEKLNREICREPDEAYVIVKNGKYTFYILEKKNQNVPGSVDQKLMLDEAMVFQYKYCLGHSVDVHYAFCISKYLKDEYLSDTQKYRSIRAWHEKNKTPILFGDDEDYFQKLDVWLSI
jgi:hypothetical protein